MNTFDPSTLIRDYGNWHFEATACRHDCALFDFSLVLGFCKPNANPNKPLRDRSGSFTDIRPVSRPFFDPEKSKPRGRFNQF